MYSNVTLLRGYSKYRQNKNNDEIDIDVRQGSEQQPLCSPESYYANQGVFCDLKPCDVPQPGGKIKIRDVDRA